MDFRLTDEQIQIRQMVKDFAESEIKPHVMEWDEAQTFPLDVVKKLGALGMLGAIFPAATAASVLRAILTAVCPLMYFCSSI